MDSIVVRPSRIRQFGAPDGAVFCLVTNPELADKVRIGDAGGYVKAVTITYSEGDDFNRMLERDIPERAHILVISPRVFFRSPRQEALGQGRKLMAMACNSTPSPLEALAHFMKVIEDTDPVLQQELAERFFDVGQKSDFFELVDERYGTRARFDHLDERYLWSEQAGPLGPGEQQLAPSGEISVLPLHVWEFDSNLFLSLNGTLALQGYTILHSGTPGFLRSDQARIHERLTPLERDALIATVENGKIIALVAADRAAEPALAMLSAMFEVDSRYRIVWEIGFAINTSSRVLPGNLAMNETYGASNGTVHFGLGFTPFTQYHLDLICPDTAVITSGGELLLGEPAGAKQPPGCRMTRVRSEGCPCLK